MIKPAEPARRVAHHRKGRAILFLNGQEVGTVQAHGGDTTWGFGEFVPNENFSAYAPYFGMWSLLMHAEDEFNRLTRDAKKELARAEEMLDTMKVGLYFPNDNEHVRVAQITIEGDRLEWKEY